MYQPQITSFIFLSTIVPILSETPPGNSTDFKKCRLSILGLEYTGYVSKTDSGVRCQSWSKNEPHGIGQNIVDQSFPEGSKKMARNYCRNPTKDKIGPWCYTVDYDLLYETCGLPLCSFSVCRLTGPGMEYGGSHRKSITGQSCKIWNKERSRVKVNDTFVTIGKYPEINFPEQDLRDAGYYCRNPSGDIGGPWCFVRDAASSQIERQYCDIPFCDDVDCLVYSGSHQMFTQYSYFGGKIENITFSVKLWDPDDVFVGEARLALTTLALPLSGEDIGNAGVGTEIYLSNKYVKLSHGSTSKSQSVPSIIKPTEFTTFSVSWSKGILELKHKGKTLLKTELKLKLQYYSITGTKILWSFPFCTVDQICDVHTTTGMDFQQFYQLHQSDIGRDLLFHVRAFQSARIILTPTPTNIYPKIIILLKGYDGFTRISLTTYPGGTEAVLAEHQLPKIISYWEWKEFHVDIFGDKLQMRMRTPSGLHSIFEIWNEQVRHMRWFSVKSDDAVAHWTFYCTPPDSFKPPVALLPDCALGDDELNYRGTQDVTSTGLPCLPWSSKKILPDSVKNMFTNNKSAIEAVNYCRDPTNLGQGTYCYAKSFKTKIHIQKHFCHLRKCKSQYCKMSGTANDFIGAVSKSRSNRTCDSWKTKINQRVIFKDSLFPDIKSGNAKNYCRNPTRNLAGSWCYTKDSHVRVDACNVRDCDWPEGCIVISTAQHKGHKVIILPRWKKESLKFSLKEWNADKTDGANLLITNWDYSQTYELHMGANNNEKIILYRDGEVLYKKTFPHLLSIGKWTDFWLQTRKNELMLGFQEVPTPFFHYVEAKGFEPSFISFSTIKGDPIGYAFDCNECHTEHVTVHNFKKTYSIGLWSQAETNRYGNLTINLRGTGVAVIKLTNLPNTGKYLDIEMDPNTNDIILQNVFNHQKAIPVKKHVNNLYTNTSWHTYLITFNEKNLKFIEEDQELFNFSSKDPMLYYWFSVAVKNGSITWSANCDPLDLDGSPRDGGWSEWGPWLCSVTCGGGEGFRSRTCTNPSPNIFGKSCEGEAILTGKCNNFECGDISPPTVDLIRNNLRLEYFSYKINEGQTIVLKNNKELLAVIKKEAPQAHLDWSLNGMFINNIENHRTIAHDNLHIKNASSSDSGVYIVVLNRINNKRLVLRVITMAVVSKKYDVITRQSKHYTINCKANLLEYVYADLKLKLYVNEKLFVEFDSGMLSAVNSYDIHLEKKHHGDWKCVVEQSDLDYQWVTNYVRIKVEKTPNLLIHLMEDEMTSPIFGWMKTELNVFLALMFMIICSVLIYFAVVGIYLRFCRMPKNNFGETHTRYEKVDVDIIDSIKNDLQWLIVSFGMQKYIRK